MSEPIYCVDCGVRIVQGTRCTMHASIHRFSVLRLSKSSLNHQPCDPPDRLQEIFSKDLASGYSINEIASHRGFRTLDIAITLRKLRIWLVTQETDPVSKFAALSIDKALENYDLHIAPHLG